MVTAAGGDTGRSHIDADRRCRRSGGEVSTTVAAGRMRRRAGRATTVGTSVGSTGAGFGLRHHRLRQALRYCCCWRRGMRTRSSGLRRGRGVWSGAGASPGGWDAGGTTKLGAASVGSTDSMGAAAMGAASAGGRRGATVVRSLRRQPAALWEQWRHARLGAGGAAPRESSRRWRCSRRGPPPPRSAPRAE